MTTEDATPTMAYHTTAESLEGASLEQKLAAAEAKRAEVEANLALVLEARYMDDLTHAGTLAKLEAATRELAATRAERDAAVAERDRCWKMRVADNAAMLVAGQREAERLKLIATEHARAERYRAAIERVLDEHGCGSPAECQHKTCRALRSLYAALAETPEGPR